MARKMYSSVEHDQSAGTEVEAEIREFVRRDVVTNRERHPDNESEMAAGKHQLGAAAGNYDLDTGDRQAHNGAEDLERHAAQGARAGSARDRPIFNLDQSGLEVDQGHRRKPDPVQKGPRRAGPVRFGRPFSRIVTGSRRRGNAQNKTSNVRSGPQSEHRELASICPKSSRGAVRRRLQWHGSRE